MKYFSVKVFFILFLCLILSVSSLLQINSQNSIIPDQTLELRDDLAVYSYELTSDYLILYVNFVEEISDKITTMSAPFFDQNLKLYEDLEFYFSDTLDLWTANISVSETSPRYLKNTILDFQVFDISPHRIILENPFFDEIIDLGIGVDHFEPNLIPQFNSVSFSNSTIEISDTINVTLDLDFPNPEILTVTGITTKNANAINFQYLDNTTYLGELDPYEPAFAEINLTEIRVEWTNNFTGYTTSYFDSVNNFPSLNIINGTTDYYAPELVLDELKLNHFVKNSQRYINATIPIIEDTGINSAEILLGSPDSTFSSSFQSMSYNATLDLYQAIFEIENVFPEFLNVGYISASDTFNQQIAYYSDEFDSPVIQRPLSVDDTPDISGPVLDDVVPTKSAFDFNEPIEIDVYASDPLLLDNSNIHLYSYGMYFEDPDGSLFTSTFYPATNFDGSEFLYFTFSYTLSYFAIVHDFPTELIISGIFLADTIGNLVLYENGVNFTSPIIPIHYPDSWYNTPSDSPSTNPPSTPSTTPSSSQIDEPAPSSTGPSVNFNFVWFSSFILVIPILLRQTKR